MGREVDTDQATSSKGNTPDKEADIQSAVLPPVVEKPSYCIKSGIGNRIFFDAASKKREVSYPQTIDGYCSVVLCSNEQTIGLRTLDSTVPWKLVDKITSEQRVCRKWENLGSPFGYNTINELTLTALHTSIPGRNIADVKKQAEHLNSVLSCLSKDDKSLFYSRFEELVFAYFFAKNKINLEDTNNKATITEARQQALQYLKDVRNQLRPQFSSELGEMEKRISEANETEISPKDVSQIKTAGDYFVTFEAKINSNDPSQTQRSVLGVYVAPSGLITLSSSPSNCQYELVVEELSGEKLWENFVSKNVMNVRPLTEEGRNIFEVEDGNQLSAEALLYKETAKTLANSFLSVSRFAKPIELRSILKQFSRDIKNPFGQLVARLKTRDERATAQDSPYEFYKSCNTHFSNWVENAILLELKKSNPTVYSQITSSDPIFSLSPDLIYDVIGSSERLDKKKRHKEKINNNLYVDACAYKFVEHLRETGYFQIQNVKDRRSELKERWEKFFSFSEHNISGLRFNPYTIGLMNEKYPSSMLESFMEKQQYFPLWLERQVAKKLEGENAKLFCDLVAVKPASVFNSEELFDPVNTEEKARSRYYNILSAGLENEISGHNPSEFGAIAKDYIESIRSPYVDFGHILESGGDGFVPERVNNRTTINLFETYQDTIIESRRISEAEAEKLSFAAYIALSKTWISEQSERFSNNIAEVLIKNIKNKNENLYVSLVRSLPKEVSFYAYADDKELQNIRHARAEVQKLKAILSNSSTEAASEGNHLEVSFNLARSYLALWNALDKEIDKIKGRQDSNPQMKELVREVVALKSSLEGIVKSVLDYYELKVISIQEAVVPSRRLALRQEVSEIEKILLLMNFRLMDGKENRVIDPRFNEYVLAAKKSEKEKDQFVLVSYEFFRQAVNHWKDDRSGFFRFLLAQESSSEEQSSVESIVSKGVTRTDIAVAAVLGFIKDNGYGDNSSSLKNEHSAFEFKNVKDIIGEYQKRNARLGRISQANFDRHVKSPQKLDDYIDYCCKDFEKFFNINLLAQRIAKEPSLTDSDLISEQDKLKYVVFEKVFDEYVQSVPNLYEQFGKDYSEEEKRDLQVREKSKVFCAWLKTAMIERFKINNPRFYEYAVVRQPSSVFSVSTLGLFNLQNPDVCEHFFSVMDEILSLQQKGLPDDKIAAQLSEKFEKELVDKKQDFKAMARCYVSTTRYLLTLGKVIEREVKGVSREKKYSAFLEFDETISDPWNSFMDVRAYSERSIDIFSLLFSIQGQGSAAYSTEAREKMLSLWVTSNSFDFYGYGQAPLGWLHQGVFRVLAVTSPELFADMTNESSRLIEAQIAAQQVKAKSDISPGGM